MVHKSCFFGAITKPESVIDVQNDHPRSDLLLMLLKCETSLSAFSSRQGQNDCKKHEDITKKPVVPDDIEEIVQHWSFEDVGAADV